MTHRVGGHIVDFKNNAFNSTGTYFENIAALAPRPLPSIAVLLDGAHATLELGYGDGLALVDVCSYQKKQKAYIAHTHGDRFVYAYSTYTYTSLETGSGGAVDVCVTTAIYNICYTHPSLACAWQECGHGRFFVFSWSFHTWSKLTRGGNLKTYDVAPCGPDYVAFAPRARSHRRV